MTGSGATPSGQETCECGAGGNEPSSDHSSWCPLTREYGSADDITATINRALRIVTAAGYQDSKGEWHPPAPAQEARSGRHVQSAARNLTPGPGMSSELDGGRQAAVEAVARDRVIAELHHHISPAIGWWRMADHEGKPFDTALLDERFARAADAVIAMLRTEVAALSQPGEPT